MTKTSNNKNVEAGEPHWIEWATGVVSAVIVLGVIAWIGKDALLDRDSSPNLVGVVLQTEKRDGGFQVLFEITNDSSATASQVTVHGEIREQGAVIEDVETVLDYVPGALESQRWADIPARPHRENIDGQSVLIR